MYSGINFCLYAYVNTYTKIYICILYFRVPEGMEDVSKYPVLFAALLDDGWTEEELGKLASNNLIRVLSHVEDIANNELNDEQPYQDWISPDDLTPEEKVCTS